MADFTAIIRRAVEGLSSNTPDMRRRVYAKARSAVVRQLENLLPRPPEYMLHRQLEKLDAAIELVEGEYLKGEGGPVWNWDAQNLPVDAELEAPTLPVERFGPTFVATEAGKIQIASASPASLRDMDELGPTIVALREAVDDLIDFSAKSNAHNSIADIARSYRDALRPPSGELAIDLMYVRGVRLQNLAKRLEVSSNSGDLPEMALRLG